MHAHQLEIDLHARTINEVLMKYVLFFALALGLMSCLTEQDRTLPILGRHEYIENGQELDTIYHTVQPFSFINQDSQAVSNTTFAGKVYVADFFFTSCPSICPLTTAQMLRVYENYPDQENLLLLSHSIDPEYDDVGVLKDYAERLNVSADKWHMVTGNKSEIYNMAQTSYYVGVREEARAPGGFEHSGAFVLVDQQGRIRGMYDGTDPVKVDQLMKDIDLLLK